jgi:hypothetical protein
MQHHKRPSNRQLLLRSLSWCIQAGGGMGDLAATPLGKSLHRMTIQAFAAAVLRLAVNATAAPALLFVVTMASHAQQDAGRHAVPTFDTLGHESLPHGFFKSWCGSDRRILMETGDALEVYERGVKVSNLPRDLPSIDVQCDGAGRHLTFRNDRLGLVSEIDIANNAIRTLVHYEPKVLQFPHISPSPDLQAVVADAPVTLDADARDLKVVQLPVSEEEIVRQIKWTSDSSLFFSVVTPKHGPDAGRAKIYDIQMRKIASGSLPQRPPFRLFREAWLSEDGKVLLFHLGSIEDEFGAGVVVRCEIAGWTCRLTADGVVSASAGGAGVLGLVRNHDTPRPPEEGGDTVLPRQYEIKIVDRASHTLARQVIASRARPLARISVAPSGAQAILAWASSFTAECRRGRGMTLCEAGVIVNLPGRMK